MVVHLAYVSLGPRLSHTAVALHSFITIMHSMESLNAKQSKAK